MPRASPEAMTKPARPMSAANMRASFWPGGRGFAGADDGEHRPRQQVRVALHVEQRRRRLEGGERGGIAGLDRRTAAARRSCRRPPARLRLRPRGQMRMGSCCRRAATARAAPRVPASAPPKWLMSSRKVTGPTLSDADQPQAGQALSPASSGACGRGAGVERAVDGFTLWAPIFGSSPARRRRMLARCFQIRSSHDENDSRIASWRSPGTERTTGVSAQRSVPTATSSACRARPRARPAAKHERRRPMQPNQHADDRWRRPCRPGSRARPGRYGRGRRRGPPAGDCERSTTPQWRRRDRR